MSLSRFWWRLRLYWIVSILKTAILIGVAASASVTLATLLITGVGSLTKESLEAIGEVASFWFYAAWSLAFLISLVLSFKKLFNKSFFGFTAVMLDCESKAVKEEIFIKDVLPLWRKFLFLLTWLFGFIAIFAVAVLKISLQSFGGVTFFIGIMIFGALLLQPLLLTTRNVRIRRSSDESSH